MGMPISTIPSSVLEDIARNWEDSAAAAEVFGGQLIGQIRLDGSLYSRERSWHEDTVEPGSFHTSEGSDLQDFAMILWLSRCPQIGDATICRCWDAGYGVGADTLTKGALVQLSVPEESVELLSNRRLLIHYGLESTEELEDCEELLGELNELYEEQIEEGDLEPCDFISDFAQEYRVEARDEIQQAFLHAMHNSVADLSEVTPFDELKKMGGGWSLSQIEDWQESAEALLKPIDFDGPNSISLAFSRLPDEHWKQHRERVRSLLKNMPEDSKNNAEVFRSIIPEVAAWVLEYAGPDVCSDPTLIDLAVEADLKHNYGASALKYASESISNNEELVAQILDKQPTEYANLPYEMRKKKDFAMKFASSGHLWRCLPEKLIKDKDVLKAYVESNPRHYSSIPEDCQDDLELAEAFINSGGDFSSLPFQLRASSDLFLLYLRNADERDLSGSQIEYAFHLYLASSGLEKTEISIDFVRACIQANQHILGVLDLSPLGADELVKFAVTIDALTVWHKFIILKVLTEKVPCENAALELIADIKSELQSSADAPKEAALSALNLLSLALVAGCKNEDLNAGMEMIRHALSIAENILTQKHLVS